MFSLAAIPNSTQAEDGQSSKVKTVASTSRHPLAPALRVAERSLKAAKETEAFSGIFSKRENVNGVLTEKTHMQIKWRSTPFSVYMKFVEPHAGREVIYVDGKNEGNLLIHETGVKSLVGTLSFKPNSPRVMAEGRYPITEIGLVKLAEAVIAQWQTETKYGEIDVKYYKNAKLNGKPCRVIQTSHPRPRKQFKFQMTRLYIDAETSLPLRVEQYGFPTTAGGKSVLMEEYEYSQLDTKADLNDIDFDTRNPNYGY